MTKKLFVAITTSAALTATAVPALASNAGNPAAGQKKSTVCVACHGTDGKSTNPMWPTLSGQNPSYLLKQLQDFKTGRRSDPNMDPMVKQLSPQDMADLAAYYASQGNRAQGNGNNNMSWNPNQNQMSNPNSGMNQNSGWNTGGYGNPNQMSGWNTRGYGNPNMNNPMSGPNSGMYGNPNMNNPMSGPNSGMYGNPNMNPMSGPNSGMYGNPNMNPMSGPNSGLYGNPNMNPMSGPNSGMYGNPNMNNPMSGPNSGAENQNMKSMPSEYMSSNNLVMRDGETFGVVMGDNAADSESGMWALIAMPNCLRLIDRFSKPLPSPGAGLPQEQIFVFQAQDSCRATIGFTRRSNQGVTAHKSYHVLVH